METIKLESTAGSHIKDVAQKAKIRATLERKPVSFDFNGIECVTDYKTNIDHLLRDYNNAHLMGWKQIGPNYLKKYPIELVENIETATKERDERHAKDQKEYREKQERDRKAFEAQIADVEFLVKDHKVYQDWKDKNSDFYGNAVFEFAEAWGRMLQLKKNGKITKKMFNDNELQPHYLGISGFQHGAAIAVLKECWIFGDQIDTK